MNISDHFELSAAYAKEALRLLEEKRLPPTPRNYEVWYTYVSQQNYRLTEELNKTIAETKKLNQSEIDKLYNDHIAAPEITDKVEQLSVEMSGEIDQIIKMIHTAMGNSAAYGQSLDRVTEKLVGVVDDEALKIIVETLVLSTNEMEQNNKQLEEQLQQADKQVVSLNHNLKSVKEESLTDQLTNIANRKCFDEEIQIMAAEANLERTEFCLLLGDIDFFKKFNDTFGHQTGDQVLRLVARGLKSNLKGRDLAARYGGEEFAVLLPQTKLQSAITVANQIRESLSSKELIKKTTGENLGTITMSFGVSRYRFGEDIESFISRADTCLYAAKHAGRDQVKCETDPGIEFEPAAMEEDAQTIVM